MTLTQLPTGSAVPAVSAPGSGRVLRILGSLDRIDSGVRAGRSPIRADLARREGGDERAVDRLLRSARTGTGGCLVVRGEPGAGPTALLGYAAGRAAGMRSVHITGIESEMLFGFGGLHQLLVPFLSRLDLLPPPQRDVLRAVAGLADGPTRDQLLVGLAILTLLAEASREQPLLVVVDNARWLDHPSALLLAFVARRVQTYPIAFVIGLDQPAPRGTPFAELPGNHPAPDAPTAPQALLRHGAAARGAEGYAAAVPAWRAAVSALLAGSAGPHEYGWDLFAAADLAADDLLDDRARYALAARWVRAERDRGASGRLAVALSSLARAEVMAGGVASAEALLTEARAAAAAGAPAAQAGAVSLAELIVLAWRGREEEARAAAARLRRSCPGVDPGVAATVTQSALTVMELASGRYQAALDCALDVYRRDPPGLGTYNLSDVVEAASRSGDHATAGAALERLTERALATGTPLALGLLARGRALLADDAAADGLYREAADHLTRTGAVPELARTRLLHGEWLRRRQRRRDARQQLQAAADLFATMGMDAFAGRARAELRATGDRAAKRADRLGGELTPQESQIARLVADGLTNRAIAARLFISPNTVEYHLQKVFRKVGVSSRTQLARAVLTQPGRADPAA